jgi:hypothetical protein
VAEDRPSHTPSYTKPGEEKLLGIEPYWWSIVVFVALAATILIVRFGVYG